MSLPLNQIICCDVREGLAGLPDESVQCCVTSPPYWGLRDYGLEPVVWGGEPGCEHEWGEWVIKPSPHGEGFGENKGIHSMTTDTSSQFCLRCGAWRGSLGLEPTPELFVEHMVEVFREVRRVLRKDGTVWLNLGDSYASAPPGNKTIGVSASSTLHGVNSDVYRETLSQSVQTKRSTIAPGLKPKDLVGIPWAVAKALQSPYYTGKIKDERDRVWLAAMIDGEGTICGFHHIRKNDGSPRTGIHINITNTSEALLQKAFEIVPAASKHVHQKHRENRYGDRDIWRWHVFGYANKQNLIEEIYPYLVAKKKQAIVAWNLLNLQKDAKRMGKTPQKEAVREKRLMMVNLLSQLNHGVDCDVPPWMIEPPSLYEPGWYLRSDIIWAKPNPMPESCRDRPTKAHEYLFLLTKSGRYFWDQEAVREPLQTTEKRAERIVYNGKSEQTSTFLPPNPNGRNLRSVWTIPTAPFPEAHFATFPPRLVEPCIKAGTSERGACPKCGAPWERVVEKGDLVGEDRGGNYKGREVDKLVYRNPGVPGMAYEKHTTGWQPTCACDAGDPVPCVTLDPFSGAGTVAVVAKALGRDYIGLEMNPEYVAMAEKRIRESKWTPDDRAAVEAEKKGQMKFWKETT